MSLFARFFKNKTATFKLTALFSTVCIAIACIYSVVMVFLLMTAEAMLMGPSMEAALDDIIYHDLTQGREPRLDNLTRLYIEGDPMHPIPDRFKDVPFGYSEYTEGVDLHVFHKEFDGTTLIMTRYQGEFEDWEKQVWIVGVAVIILISAFCIIGGYFLAKRTAVPIENLAKEAERMTEDLKSGQIVSVKGLDGPWGEDEIGKLGKALQNLYTRLRGMILQEKQFVSEVSHEMRTPLSVVSTSLEILAEDQSLNEKQKRIVARAFTTSQRLNELVTVFLSLFRHQDINSEELVASLPRIIHIQKDFWEEQAKAKGLVFKEVVEGIPEHRYNRILALSVLNNLILNSINYTENGSITLTLRQNEILISDTGPGFSEEEREKIFDEGFRGTNTKGVKGFGLGLTIAKRCCNTLGWGLTALSEKGKGSTFVIHLNS